jgi:hypothetical protein
MRRPFATGIVIFFAAILGLSTLAWATDWDGPDRHDTNTIEVTGANGQPLPDNTTVIVNSDRDRDGFRGFFLFPLFLIFGLFLLFRFVFFRERIGPPGWSRNGWNTATPPPWFDEWHRRYHEQSASRSTTKNDAANDVTPEP